jgi:hypothetical protein
LFDLSSRKARNLNCNGLQCDETWSFCEMKQKNAAENQAADKWVGDVHTYTDNSAEPQPNAEGS